MGEGEHSAAGALSPCPPHLGGHCLHTPPPARAPLNSHPTQTPAPSTTAPPQVSLYGLVTIDAFYLPFAFVFINIIMGGSPVPDLFGIAAGHVWYFFTDLYPRSSGRCAGVLFSTFAVHHFCGGRGGGTGGRLHACATRRGRMPRANHPGQ